MASFTSPQYNLLANIWTCDGTKKPSAGPPDVINVPCQKYMQSRINLEVSPPWFTGYWVDWQPPVILRFPRSGPFAGPWTGWKAVCFEVPAGSGQYYRTYWQEVIHEGFINEYAVLMVTQCDADLLSFPPAGGSEPTGFGHDACGVYPPGSAPLPVIPPGPLPLPVGYITPFQDKFNDAPATPLSSHISDSGNSWAGNVANGNITGSGVGAVILGNPGQVWYVANYAGPTDGIVQLVFSTPLSLGTAVYMGIIVRASDPLNWIAALIEWVGASTWQMTFYKCIAGVPTSLGVSSPTFTLATNTDYAVVLTMKGSSIIADFGTGIASCTLTDSSYQLNTKVGMWWYVDASHPSCIVSFVSKF